MKKKLLLIAPLFFGYYKEMCAQAECIGLQADYICDAPSNSNFSKALGRVNKKLIQGAAKRYFDKKVLPALQQKKYDYVLVVGGMTFAFTKEMVQRMRQIQKDAEFVLYQWDSEENLPYSTGIHPYFDRRYSFDRNDCARDNKYRFLPLFYTSAFAAGASVDAEEQKYDCIYVGTAHPQKLQDINRIAEAVKDIMPRQHIYHYMPSKLKFFYHKLLAPEFRKAKADDFQYEKVPYARVISLIRESKAVLDAPQTGQTGLTIRTIECLGAKRKLITTNPDIKNYDFYHKENILVFDGQINPEDPFFTKPYKDIPSEIYRKYALENWLRTMLGWGAEG